jgi:hypothetical protein
MMMMIEQGCSKHKRMQTNPLPAWSAAATAAAASFALLCHCNAQHSRNAQTHNPNYRSSQWESTGHNSIKRAVQSERGTCTHTI